MAVYKSYNAWIASWIAIYKAKYIKLIITTDMTIIQNDYKYKKMHMSVLVHGMKQQQLTL